MVPVGERAARGMRGEILREPRLLRRARAAAADLGAVRVQRDEVPGADVEAVVALAASPAAWRRSSRSSRRAPGVLYSWLPGTGRRDRLHAAPRRVVRLRNSPSGRPRTGCRRAAARRRSRAPTRRSEVASCRQRGSVSAPAVERRARRIAGDVVRPRRSSAPRRARPATTGGPVGSAPRRGDDERDREDDVLRRGRLARSANGSPAANDFRIRRATTMRCTSSGPS